MIGAMKRRYPTKVPESMLDALGKCLKAFAETECNGFDIRVGEHKMIDQVRKRFPGNGNPQIAHVRKI
jgi:hypothetical protein